MGGDYTRFTFDPLKGFSGVRKQQGRVSLDADFNELEEIIDRRRRAQMYDTVGQAVVPMTTPNGFEIGVAGGELTIGAGRAYVDGILAECFGDTSQTTVRDDVLGGVRGSGPLRYRQQPFAYASQAPAGVPDYPVLAAKAGTINLVYLDVWQREVTVWEDDALRDPALNGPDTATRVQTAWQVKVMKGATAASCAAPPPAWTELTAPSTARLTARATGVLAPPPGPCVINPAGGYTGLENRLYRVEVQKAGTLGGATPAEFKWSRDNASLAARVLSITKVSASESTITVSATGRDAWMRFEHGDHIELLDDHVELAMRESRQGGLMASILRVDHADGKIYVDRDLSGFTIDPARHPRLRRWDIETVTEPLTRPATAGATIPLEHGISITFGGAATDTLHAGDFWVFAARTADGSIDTVVNAPPRGILHHFARLALVTSGTPPVRISDCRIFWPQPTGGHGESCCTVVVKPGEDIQRAIDSLTGVGGCVCLKMGVHTITQPLTIRQSNLTLHAEAPWTIVKRVGGGAEMLKIGSPSPPGTPVTLERNISVMGIHFQVDSGKQAEKMIEIVEVTGGRIAECRLSLAHPVQEAGAVWGTTGVALSSCSDYQIESNLLEGLAVGIVGDVVERLRVLDNTLMGWAVGGDNARRSAGLYGVAFGKPVSVDVERNALSDYRRGIQLGDLTVPAPAFQSDVPCRIAANVITRQTLSQESPASFAVLAYAIAAHVERCEIIDNAVLISGASDGGVLSYCADVLIARNLIRSTLAPAFGLSTGNTIPQLPFGVVAGLGGSTLRCVVQENVFKGLQQAVYAIAISPSTAHLEIASNTIVGVAQVMKVLLAGPLKNPMALLLTNSLRLGAITIYGRVGGQVRDNQISEVPCGVITFGAVNLSVSANHVRSSAVAVFLFMAEACRVSDNAIEEAVGGVWAMYSARCAIERNVVRDAAMAGILDLIGLATRYEGNHIRGGLSGIDVGLVVEPDVRGNTVEDAAFVGIGILLSLGDTTLADNRMLRCGYQSAPTLPLGVGAMVVSYGIASTAISTRATVSVESCHALSTGEPPAPGGPVFNGLRVGIMVLAVAANARVHNCVITSPQLRPSGQPGSFSALSRGLAVITMTTAGSEKELMTVDIADNLVEQSCTPVVDVQCTDGEVMFADNRCKVLPGARPGAGVTLTGRHVIVTGNRVRALASTPSLVVTATGEVTGVSNMTTGGATIISGALTPAPWTDFNVPN